MSVIKKSLSSYVRTSNPKHSYTFNWSIENCHGIAPGTVIWSSYFYPLNDKNWHATFEISDDNEQMILRFHESSSVNLKLICRISVCNVNNHNVPGFRFHSIGKYEYAADISQVKLGLKERLLKPCNFPQGLLVIICKMTFMGYEFSTSNVNLRTVASPPSVEMDSLRKQLKEMLYNSRYSDVTFDLDGYKIDAHKNILSARSTVFEKMFSNDIRENATRVIIVEDILPIIFKILLEYLYTGILVSVDFDTVRALYYAADKYAVLELRGLCKDILLSNLAMENAFGLLSLAEKHSDTDFFNAVLDFVKFHMWNDSIANACEQINKYPELFAIMMEHLPNSHGLKKVFETGFKIKN